MGSSLLKLSRREAKQLRSLGRVTLLRPLIPQPILEGDWRCSPSGVWTQHPALPATRQPEATSWRCPLGQRGSRFAVRESLFFTEDEALAKKAPPHAIVHARTHPEGHPVWVTPAACLSLADFRTLRRSGWFRWSSPPRYLACAWVTVSAVQILRGLDPVTLLALGCAHTSPRELERLLRSWAPFASTRPWFHAVTLRPSGETARVDNQ